MWRAFGFAEAKNKQLHKTCRKILAPRYEQESHWFSAGGTETHRRGPNNCRPMMPSAAVRLAVAVGLAVGIFGRESTGVVAAARNLRNKPPAPVRNAFANAHHELRRLGHDEPTPSPSLDPDDEETVAIIVDGQPRQIEPPTGLKTDEPTGTLTPEPTGASDVVDQMIMEEFEKMAVPTPRPTKFRVVTTDELTDPNSEFAPSVFVLFCAYAWRCTPAWRYTGYVCENKGQRMPHRPSFVYFCNCQAYAHSSYILYIYLHFFSYPQPKPKQVPGGNRPGSRPSGRRPVPPRRP